MRDEQIKELISAYVDGELSVDERAQVERHLADSVECQQFLDRLQRQRVALRSLPRHKLKIDLSQRVLQAIEQARPVVQPAIAPTVSPRDHAAKRNWWQSWQGIAVAASTVAALILVSMYLTSENRNTNNPSVPKDLLVPNVPKLPGAPKLPDEIKPPEETGPEAELPAESLLAVKEFQKLVHLIMIYDVTISPQAQKDKVFEGWMAKAGLPVNKGVAIDQKLAKEILASRFVGNAKIGADLRGELPRDEVEMLFVRGTGKQIDAVGREYFVNGVRAQQSREIRMSVDLVVAPRDLSIILQLNKATGLDLAEMKANPSTLKSAAVFPLQFQRPLHTVSTAQPKPTFTLAMATDAQFASNLVAQSSAGPPATAAPAAAASEAQPEVEGSVGWEDPSQAIIIIRRLKAQPPKGDANKQPSSRSQVPPGNALP